MPPTSVSIQFPAAAFALLLAIAIQGGHASVEALLHTLAMNEARAFCVAHGSEITPEINELFTQN